MTRVAITNGKGAWFNTDSAQKIEEESYHDGYNFISEATGSQWEHECLWITRGGKFVLNHWSQYQGGVETYKLIDKKEAAEWISKQSFEWDDIPGIFRGEVESFEII